MFMSVGASVVSSVVFILNEKLYVFPTEFAVIVIVFPAGTVSTMNEVSFVASVL